MQEVIRAVEAINTAWLDGRTSLHEPELEQAVATSERLAQSAMRNLRGTMRDKALALAAALADMAYELAGDNPCDIPAEDQP